MSQKHGKASSLDFPLLAREMVERTRNEANCKPQPGLYLVATPIGNLGDITLRALAVLAHADAIACEDTRTSGVMLQAYGIDRPLFSYHDHNEDEKRPLVMQRLSKGEVIALISDAGIPAIADPGFKLVRDCRNAGHPVTVIPGPNAAVTAMAGSGLPTDQFCFGGFLPTKPAARRKFLLDFRHRQATLVFYETPQRLADSLTDLTEALGAERPAVVARELTKFFEELRRGTLAELASHYAEHDTKGEIVILVGKEPENPENDIDIDKVLAERLKALSVRDAVAEVAEMSGISKKEVYARALEIAARKKK